MISDKERLIDGFRGLPAGVDGSKDPPQTPSAAVWYATNATFRGGNGPRTRPGFREIRPDYWRNPQDGGEEDIDLTFAEDYINGTNSFDRYGLDILGATYVQGACVYQDPREDNPTQIVLVADGKIMALNLNEGSCFRLNLNDEISADVPVFMAQAEEYLIIQTGQDEPRIYDGYTVRRASAFGDVVVPVGKQMAYGQGRLFVVVNDGTEILAGDLVFGGSTTSVGITGSTAANPAVLTTEANHTFSDGDLVTISGHSSTPPVNSTYAVSATTATTFTVPVSVTTAGRGGSVARFNAGQSSDLLRFSENTFLNEGGSLAPMGKVGRITGLAFLPVQDTATGQGDLVAFCARGAVTFQVSAPRDQWKNLQGFQRVLFDNIGSTAEVIPVNGDLFFRSLDGNGIRTYRNARAESSGYGQTPISAEIDPVLQQDTAWMLDAVSFASFDNRLLMTCLPRKFPRRAVDDAQAEEFAAEPVPTLFEGLAVLDFQSASSGRGKAAAVFDGVWTGLRVVKLLQGIFDKESRCFAVCFHEDETGRRVELWEVTKNDEFDTPVEGRRPINAGIVTRAFDFNDPMGLKKLIRCDLWFSDLGGGTDFPFTCNLAYRPDDYPNFTDWETAERTFVTEFEMAYADPGDATPVEPYNLERGYAPQVRFPTPSLAANIATEVPAYMGHDFTLRINWTGRAHLGRLMLHGYRLVESVNGGSL
jgi:hypothetical protein